jgi:hypothetical protein
MKALLFSTLLLSSFSVSATVTSGLVTSGAGSFIKITDPTELTVGNNNFNDLNLYAFDEVTNFTLTSDLAVDNTGTGSSGFILNGTQVASHYISFDPLSTARQQGTVHFSSTILGVITSTTKLSNSDFLKHADVTYLGTSLRGLESGDSATISADLLSLNIDWAASSPGDYLRVVTAVPVPAAFWLFGSSLLGIFATSITRKKKK